jgi:hypothetical protein
MTPFMCFLVGIVVGLLLAAVICIIALFLIGITSD